MLHCGNEFRMEVCSFRFKLDDIVPRNGKILVLEHKAYLKKFLLILL